MTHYFTPPSSFRLCNCKGIPGERARKKCQKWNSLIKKRNKFKLAGKEAELAEIEAQLLKF